jgi:DNA mismatch repair protein MutH
MTLSIQLDLHIRPRARRDLQQRPKRSNNQALTNTSGYEDDMEVGASEGKKSQAAR